jgi:uncharacterized protein (TIGR02001 family)
MMTMKIINSFLAGLAVTVMAFSPALAEESKQLIPGNFSANVGLFSDYTFRGISQTTEKPAIQGGFDYSLDTGVSGIGIFLGTWASNVEFGDGDEANIEIDWYGGLSKTFGGVDVSAGFLYYTYPGAADSLNYDFLEGTLGLGYGVNDNLSLGINYAYSGEYFGDSGTEHYIQGAAKFTVPVKDMSLTLDATVGRQLIQKNDVFGTPDYTDWRIGATLGITDNVSATVFYTDTDISETECGSENCDPRVQFVLTASF